MIAVLKLERTIMGALSTKEERDEDFAEKCRPLLKSNASRGSTEEVTDEGTKIYLVKVVLLLLDAITRRFELLQFEFDTKKALVSDVLAQIHVSVTEVALRKQTYTGICGKEGKELMPEECLATLCSENGVLVAIPEGLPATECAQLARAILNDRKVVNMVCLSKCHHLH